MNRTAMTRAIGALAAGLLLLAGCADDPASDNDTPSTGGTSGTTPATAVTTVADCVVGQWRSTGLPPAPDGGTADADLTGGAGFQVTVDRSGATTVTFDDMQPVTFSARIGQPRSAASSPTPGRQPER